MFNDAIFDTFWVLESERCILRAITTDDAPDILRLYGDPEFIRYLGRHPLKTIDEAMKRVQVFQNTFQEQSGLVWGVTDRTSGKFMGTCLLWDLSKAHFRAEIGYGLEPAAWGKGIMSEVVQIALDFAFNRMGLHSVAARIDPNNTGSRKLLEKCGFVQEAYFREDFYDPVKATFTDTAVFSLLKSSWQQHQK